MTCEPETRNKLKTSRGITKRMNRSRACGPISTSMYIRPDAVILDVIRLEDREARMRFSILNIAMAIAIAALTVALVVDRINDKKTYG